MHPVAFIILLYSRKVDLVLAFVHILHVIIGKKTKHVGTFL